jgi:hypothetical protein
MSVCARLSAGDIRMTSHGAVILGKRLVGHVSARRMCSIRVLGEQEIQTSIVAYWARRVIRHQSGVVSQQVTIETSLLSKALAALIALERLFTCADAMSIALV